MSDPHPRTSRSSPRPASPRGRRAPPQSRAERVAKGKAARAKAPLESHADFAPGETRPDPVDLLLGQAESRVPELIPIRHGRMLVSPFTFYRGAALPMAADLATTASAGLGVQLCGDAHLSNFGVFAVAGTPAGVRPQRLRRDASWPLRVGREAPRCELRGRHPGERVQREGAPEGRHDCRRVVPEGDAGVRRAADPRRLVRPAGHRVLPRRASAPPSSRRGSRTPMPRWPRPAAATACRQ